MKEFQDSTYFNSGEGLPGVVYSLAGELAQLCTMRNIKKKSAAQAQDMKKIGDICQAARNNVKRLTVGNLNI